MINITKKIISIVNVQFYKKNLEVKQANIKSKKRTLISPINKERKTFSLL